MPFTLALSRFTPLLALLLLCAGQGTGRAAPTDDRGSRILSERAAVLTRQGRPEQALALSRRTLPNLRTVGGKRLAEALYDATYDDVLIGRYADAERSAKELVAGSLPFLDPGIQQEVRDDVEIWHALAGSPPMTAALNGPIHLPMARSAVGQFMVPVSANGTTLSWVFDTGANLTVLNTTTARKLGAKVLGEAHTMAGTTGTENVIHVGLLQSLTIGSAELRNIPVLIFTDEALTIATPRGSYVIAAAAGFPVMRALRNVTFSRAAGFVANDAGFLPKLKGAELGVKGLGPIATLYYGDTPIPVSIDTGANASAMTKRYQDLLARGSFNLSAKAVTEGGAGGFRSRGAIILPEASLRAGSRVLQMHKLRVFVDNSGTGLDTLFGNMGQDLWQEADGPVFDFVGHRFYVR